MSKSYNYIGIVKFPGVQLAAVYGLTDMLTIANDMILERDDREDRKLFCVSHWSLDSEEANLEQGFSAPEIAQSTQNVIIVPGTITFSNLSDLSSVITDWIRDQHSGGAIASSVCKGAFALARSGILENRSVTTHWVFKDEFSTLFPTVNLADDEIVVDGGDIITAGGVMAWLDLGLKLIHQFAGPEIMVAVAKFLLIDPSGRNQKFYRAFTPPLDHGDEVVIKAQHWLQSNYSQPLSLAVLAEESSVSERTLIRRFQNAIDMTPTTYIQMVRIGKARELLEFSNLPVNHIAREVGYEDSSAFRKIFQRNMGSPPREYRRRFNAK